MDIELHFRMHSRSVPLLVFMYASFVCFFSFYKLHLLKYFSSLWTLQHKPAFTLYKWQVVSVHTANLLIKNSYMYIVTDVLLKNGGLRGAVLEDCFSLLRTMRWQQ